MTSLILYGLYGLFRLYTLIMVIDCILSWFPRSSRGIGYAIHQTANAYLGHFRGLLVIGFLDFTPLIGFFVFEGITDLIGMLVI